GGQHDRGGRDAGSAVGDEPAALAGVEQLLELPGWEVAAVRRDRGERHVRRAGDVAGDRVDRLVLAAEARGGPGVYEGERVVEEAVHELVRGRDVVLPGARLERRAAHPRARRHVVKRTARLAPRAQAAVED